MTIKRNNMICSEWEAMHLILVPELHAVLVLAVHLEMALGQTFLSLMVFIIKYHT